MSSLVAQIRENMLVARRSGDKGQLAVLSVLLGEIQNLQNSKGQRGEVTDTQIVRVIRKLMKSNDETLARLSEAAPQHEKLMLENGVLLSLLPRIWSVPETIEYLRHDKMYTSLMAQRTDGMAIGIALKLLNSRQLPVDSKNVAEAVRELRDYDDGQDT